MSDQEVKKIKAEAIGQFANALDVSIHEYAELFKDRNIISDAKYYEIMEQKSTGKKLNMLLEAIRYSDKLKQIKTDTHTVDRLASFGNMKK